MNPLQKIEKFIEECRENGIPDRAIYEGIQVAMVEAAMIEITQAQATQPAKPTRTSRPVIGFVNSSK